MWLLGNGLTARRTLRPEAAHCRVGEKSKQNQSTDRAAMCGLLSSLHHHPRFQAADRCQAPSIGIIFWNVTHRARERLMSDMKFRLERVSGAPVSNDEILSDLRRAAELAGTTVVTQKLYSEFGRYNPSTALRRFGTWNNAVVAAGLQIANEINFTDERLFENIMLLWEHFGRQPRRAELAKPPSVISQSAYLRRFHSWTDALTQFVPYANAQDIRPPSPIEIPKGHKTGRDPSLRLRFRVMKRDNFSCRACGASPASEAGLTLHVDHVVAWSRGGETIDDNLQTLCEPCNLGKSNVL
jgi:5-methylcytosine-specific restriction endonuclease McrA